MTSAAPSRSSAETQVLETLRTSVAADLRELARLHDREPDVELLAALHAVEFPRALGLRLESPAGLAAAERLHDVVAALASSEGSVVLDVLAADYAAIYLNGRLGTPPSESPWIDDDGLVCQAPMFQARAWYRRSGWAVPNWRLRPDDHLVFELDFLARTLAEGELEEALREGARFLDAHLLRWVGPFAERVGSRCDTAFFAALAALTAAYLEELRDLLSDATGEPRSAATRPESPARGEVEPAASSSAPGVGPGW